MKISELKVKGMFDEKEFVEIDLAKVHDLEVKEFISIAEVSMLRNDVAEKCLELNDDLLLECNFITKKMATDVGLLFYFAGVEFDAEGSLVEDYDLLTSYGVLNVIKDKINQTHLAEILDIIDLEVEQRIGLNNSVETSMARVAVSVDKGINAIVKMAETIVKKLPSNRQINNLLKNLVKELKGLDLKTLGFNIKEEMKDD